MSFVIVLSWLLLARASDASAALPGVYTGYASGITESSAMLEGSVISETSLLECRFEWGLSAGLGSSVPCVYGQSSPGELVPVTAQLTGLAAGTTYQFRLAARNEAGIAYGSIYSLQTSAPLPPERAEGEPLPAPLLEVPPEIRRQRTAPGRRQSDPHDAGLYVAYCPPFTASAGTGTAAANGPLAAVALANHTGWPKDQCLKMDKGSYGRSHTLIGAKKVHNYLLGGYGNDTVFAGDDGDVVWGDYQPAGQSEHEHDRLHGGAGADWIYSSHGLNEIWTGAGNDHVALIYGHGTVHCNGSGVKTLVMRYLAQNRHWRLIGCSDKRIEPYKA